MINRALTSDYNNSFFLFGARGTGKTTWLKEEFIPFHGNNHLFIDLLNPDEEEKYSKNSGLLKLEVGSRKDKNTWIVLDEVQKVPKLLNVVHQCMQEFGTRFVLTGSSARKLKRGSADMLAGRAFLRNIFPFCHREMDDAFHLHDVLSWGSLPQIFQYQSKEDKKRFLKAYTRTYLKEEIMVEQIVRKLDPFKAFLEIAAQQNTEIVNYSNIARSVGVDTVTVQSYFQILEDTLVGYLLPAYHRAVRKRQRENPKFYYFDIGIARELSGTITQVPVENTYGYGKLFEHFVIIEAVRLNSYKERDFNFFYLRTKDNAEIDLVVERPGMPLAIVEIKSTDKTDDRDVRSLARFKKDMGNTEAFCLSRDPVAKICEGINLLPWEKGLEEIGL